MYLLLTEPTDISNELSRYFFNIGENLVNNLAFNHALSMTDFKKYCDKPLENSMCIWSTHVQEVTLLIKKLKCHKAAGPDGIIPSLIKSAAPVLIEHLLHVFNLSLTSGQVPAKMRTACIQT